MDHRVVVTFKVWAKSDFLDEMAAMIDGLGVALNALEAADGVGDVKSGFEFVDAVGTLRLKFTIDAADLIDASNFADQVARDAVAVGGAVLSLALPASYANDVFTDPGEWHAVLIAIEVTRIEETICDAG